MINDRGRYYWVKRVPKRYTGLVLGADGQPVSQVRQALHTDSLSEAKAKALQVEVARLSEWEALAASDHESARAHYDASKTLAQARGYAWRSSSLDILHRQNPGLITAEHMRIAREFQMIYLGRQEVTADVYSVVRQSLAPRLSSALEEVCGKSTGLEALEALLKIPARSGKAVVALALETLDHTGALS